MLPQWCFRPGKDSRAISSPLLMAARTASGWELRETDLIWSPGAVLVTRWSGRNYPVRPSSRYIGTQRAVFGLERLVDSCAAITNRRCRFSPRMESDTNEL